MKNFKKAALVLMMASTTAFAGDLVISTGGEGGGYEALGKNVAAQIARQKGHDFDF